MQLDLQQIWLDNQDVVIGWGLKLAGAILLLLIGINVAGMLARAVRKQALKYESIDDTLGNFFASIVRWFITAGVIIASLQVFGVEATSLVAILGALTLAIGLSLQGALGNIASGVMLMLFRPYKLGDYIEAQGAAGTVKDINLFQTVLATVDNVQIMIPNSQAISGTITNYSGYEDRRVDITFGIDYGDDMDKAIALIEGVILNDARITTNIAAPFIKVTNLNESSVDISTRTWVRAEDYWDVKFDFIKKVKLAFDANGISIPYPHTTIEQKVPASAA